MPKNADTWGWIAAALVASVLALALVSAVLYGRANPDAIPDVIPPALRPAPDPWAIATRETQDLLRRSPEFAGHMLAYRTLPAEIDAYLSVVERARIALAASDELRKTTIPVLGNAWQVLVNVLNAVLPGTGNMLDGLDDTLRQVLAFKGKLATLRDADAVAVAVQRFQDSPSRKTLVALRDSCAFYSEVLSDVDRDVQSQQAMVGRAVERVERIEQALSQAEGAVSRLPLLPDALRSLKRSVSDLFEPLRNVQKALDQLHSQIQADLATMGEIQRIVASAEQP